MDESRKKELGELLKIEQKRARLVEIEQLMQAQTFWADYASAQQIMQELSDLKKTVDEFDLAESDEELTNLEQLALLSGPYDDNPAIMTIHAGSGGVEAQDWAEMLMRMYLRLAERRGWRAEIIDRSNGEEAGIKSATIELRGAQVYGWLKAEAGVHRLVRMSPFDADKARHTSFALVQVIPEIIKSTFVINPQDVRVDVYRASGKGGQGVNTTDSAVRLTHIPTNIVVTVQNERSQLQNKETAMRILASRLELLEKAKFDEEKSALRGEFKEAAWGNQIRSYVLAPYQLVKDHRTEFESSNPKAVLDGELDGFLDAGLKYFKES